MGDFEEVEVVYCEGIELVFLEGFFFVGFNVEGLE